jgi:prepilin-type N-terminal cleavage/methylation domain-containing protein
MRSEQGFTLIELLTIIAIIGVLAALSLSGFSIYRASAAYAVATGTMHDARNALEAALADQSNLPAQVPLQAQVVQGEIANVLGKAMLPGMQLPRNMKLQYSYDPACVDAGCIETFLQTNHCYGIEFPRFVRFGDGVEVLVEHIGGAGCG